MNPKIKLLFDPNIISHRVELRYSFNNDEMEEKMDSYKNLTINEALDLIEENLHDWTDFCIFGNVWENGNNTRYEKVAEKC